MGQINSKAVQWLYGELPGLVAQDVLTADSADSLRRHYDSLQSGQRARPLALIIFSVLGSLLIGAGIILLLAYNWEELSRPLRAAIVLFSLIGSQALVAWALWKPDAGTGLKEGAAGFLVIAIGASISLIAQTYHISGDLSRFLLVWMVLALPLGYLTGSSFPIMLHLALATYWVGLARTSNESSLLFWPLLVAALPHFILIARADQFSPRTALVGWVLSACFCVATTFLVSREIPGLWIVTYSGLFASLYLAGIFGFDGLRSSWVKPFQTVGTLGVAVLSLVLSFEWPWREIGWNHYRSVGMFDSGGSFTTAGEYLFTAALPLTAVCLLVTCHRRGKPANMIFGVAPIVAGVAFAISAPRDWPLPGLVIFNAYLLVLSVGSIATGLRKGQLAIVNGGMALLTAQILIRFFDSDMSFLTRGIAFIALGACFLLVNVVLLRTKAKTLQGGAS